MPNSSCLWRTGYAKTRPEPFLYTWSNFLRPELLACTPYSQRRPPPPPALSTRVTVLFGLEAGSEGASRGGDGAGPASGLRFMI